LRNGDSVGNGVDPAREQFDEHKNPWCGNCSKDKGGNIKMASAASSPKLERDPVTLDPKHYNVEVENEQMRVVRIKYRAHEKSPMHQHPRGAVVFLTDAHFKFTYPDGKTEELRKKAGECMAYTEPWEHKPENLNGKDFEAVYVEIRK